MNSNLDVYRDRVYPAEDDNDRWNQNLDWNTNYQYDPKTSLKLSYTLHNNLGSLSQSRYQSSGLGISKKFKFIRDISSYANYYHQENKNFSSPRADYINDRTYAGLRFSLIGRLYYYLNKEFNWTQERFTGNYSRPDALETGVDWAGQFGKSPLHGSFRFSFRDEEDAGSGLSFMVGEDYIEGYTELSYRPTDDTEIYGSCRARNVWADSPSVLKRLEMSFNAGMRYLWNTGFRWEAVGDIEGYVFRDLNSDGLRQREEAPVEGIKVWLGKDKSQVTDVFGYFRFKKVKARKAYINLDTSTIPAGFVLTFPATQEVSLSHLQTVGLYFGIISRSEIRGYVFEDIDGNGDYNRGDVGVQGVVLTLENATKAVTDMAGRYSFSNTPVGEHTVTVDLNSLPVYYLPKVSLTKKITLFEGVTYIHNIPLKRIKE